MVVLAVLALAAATGLAEQPPSADTEAGLQLTIRIGGLRSSEGFVAIALFDSPSSYDARAGAVIAAFVPITASGCEWIVDGLPPGEYAAMAYQDKNGNGKLDKRPFGLPREPYGFSNDARATFGPPRFEKASFTLDRNRTIEFRVR